MSRFPRRDHGKAAAGPLLALTLVLLLGACSGQGLTAAAFATQVEDKCARLVAQSLAEPLENDPLSKDSTTEDMAAGAAFYRDYAQGLRTFTAELRELGLPRGGSPEAFDQLVGSLDIAADFIEATSDQLVNTDVIAASTDAANAMDHIKLAEAAARQLGVAGMATCGQDSRASDPPPGG